MYRDLEDLIEKDPFGKDGLQTPPSKHSQGQEGAECCEGEVPQLQGGLQGGLQEEGSGIKDVMGGRRLGVTTPILWSCTLDWLVRKDRPHFVCVARVLLHPGSEIYAFPSALFRGSMFHNIDNQFNASY